MKKLTNTCLIATAFSLIIISCSKDPLPSDTGQTGRISTSDPQPEPQVSTVSITGSHAELSLYVHSNAPLSTSYFISIDQVLKEEFDLPYGEKKTWQLNNLSSGTYRVILRQGELLSTPYYFSLSIEITDNSGIHRVNPTSLGKFMYAFDLEVKN